MSASTHNPEHRQPILRVAILVQLCFLLLLSWFSADQSAHHRLHHFLDAVCKMCGQEAEADAGAGPVDRHGGDDDADCSIELFAHGHAGPGMPPVSILAPKPTVLFLNAPTLVPDFPPSRHLLPFACGPPCLI